MTGRVMRRAQFDRYGPPEVLHVVRVPVPEPAPGEVLVRVHAASVNRGEVWARAGRLRLVTRGPFPRATGIDFAGEVVRIGGRAPGVEVGVEVGEAVWGVLPTRQRAGGRVGSAAEYVTVPAGMVGRSPAGADPVDAAALLVGGVNALIGLHDVVGLRPGERLLVRGAAGGVGTAAVQLGRALGARVTGLAGARHLDLVRELGAGRALDHATTGPGDLGPFDVVFDAHGADLAAYRRLLAPGGRMVSIALDLDHLLRSVGTVVASTVHGPRRIRFFRGAPARDLFDRVAVHVERGDIRAVVDTVHALPDIADAHRALESPGTRGKHVIRIADG